MTADQTTPPENTGTAPALPGGIPPLWTVAEAARFLRKSPRWVWYALRLADTEPGSIPHCKLGRSPRFDPEDLRAWAAMRCPPAATFRRWQEGGRRPKPAS